MRSSAAIRSLGAGFLLCALGITFSAHADFDHCAPSVLKNPTTRQAVTFLQSVAGKYRVDKCLVEINVCSGRADKPNSTTSADIMITDEKGVQWYVPLDLTIVDTDLVSHDIENGRRMVHYEYTDHIPDKVNGSTEAYRLEIVKTDDLSHVDYIELGFYTSKLRQKFPDLDPGEARWIVCGNNGESDDN